MINQYKINEFGEIISEDYFFKQVNGSGVQILPFQRKYWKIFLLNVITIGIYGLVVGFAMAKETNITCVGDGKTTNVFWKVIGLSIITLGIYAVVWYAQWLNRESAFLKSKNKQGSFNGRSYLLMLLLVAISSVVPLLPIVFNFIILYLVVNQHNNVNTAYNEMNNFIEKI